MAEVIGIDESVLLERHSNSRKQRLRKNIQLLFLGLSAEETAPLITLLRTSRLSPRGKPVNSEQEFLEALSERSWDLILCTIDRDNFTSKQAVKHLKQLGKDIPVIQIIPSSDSHLLLQGLKNHLHAVVPLDEKELVLISIRRELDNLDYRRRLRKAESALAEEIKRTRQLMDSSRSAICCCSEGRLNYANESFHELFGLEHNDKLIGTNIIDFFTPDDRADFQEQLQLIEKGENQDLVLQRNARRNDHSEFTANLELSLIEIDGEKSVRVNFRVDEHSLTDLISEDLDFVSGLYNKSYLAKQLEQITQRALRGGNDCSLIYIELDQLNQIKARRGNEGSDQLIRDISALLQRKVNKAHLLTHPEENAFVIIFKDPNIQTAQSFAETLCREIARTRSNISDIEVQSTCSIGIAVINDSTPPPQELLQRAISAIEKLRENSPQGNGVLLHIPEEVSEERENDEFEALREAIEKNEFKLLFQPVVNLTAEDQSSHHYEALLRLNSDTHGELAPNEFMSAIGDKETAIKVDRWVIEQGLTHLKRGLNQEHRDVLFLNISAHALSDKKLLTWLSGVLRKNNIPADRLVFQISESDISISPRQAQVFTEKLDKIHCQVCVKHFGSLPNYDNMLTNLHASFVKLDGSFITELGKDSEQDEHFLSMVTQLKSLGKTTIAPMVENPKIMPYLWKAGVDFIQGYYLQPPRDKMDYDFFAE